MLHFKTLAYNHEVTHFDINYPAPNIVTTLKMCANTERGKEEKAVYYAYEYEYEDRVYVFLLF